MAQCDARSSSLKLGLSRHLFSRRPHPSPSSPDGGLGLGGGHWDRRTRGRMDSGQGSKVSGSVDRQTVEWGAVLGEEG